MKKILLSAFALTAIVACKKDVNLKQDDSLLITFDNSFVEIKTRAAIDPSITTASIDAFDVWGYMDNPTAVVLEKERVTKATDGTWSYENLQYWTQNHNYYFGAIAPVDNADITPVANAGELQKVNFVNTDGTVDLLYAYKTVRTYEDITSNDPGKISLQFAHQLSKVKFTFVNAFPNKNTKIVVKDLKMVAPGSGQVDLATGIWSAETTTTTTLEFGDVEGGKQIENTTGNNTGECDYERLTIPCNTQYAYTITFTVELYHGTYATPAYTGQKTVTLTGQEFKIGKMYNLKAIINAENLELLPIEFDVIEVETWEQDTAVELTF